MKFRAYGNIRDSKTSKAITGATIKLYLNKEELQKGKSVENGFYELIVEIDDSSIENGQQLRLTFEMEGYQMQEHHVLATEGSFNLDVAFEAAPAPPKKPFNWLPVIIAGVALLILLVVGGAIAWWFMSRPKSPKIISFAADPNSIKIGSSATLSWETKNAVDVKILPNVGGVDASGSRTISPRQTTDYTLIAKNKEDKTVEKTVQIGVTIPPPPRIVFFKAGENTINRGGQATLSWEATNAIEVQILPDVGSVEASGSRTVTPSQTTTYTLIAKNEDGKTAKSEAEIRVLTFKDGYYKIIAKHSGKCLSVYGVSKADAANVVQWGCVSYDNQLFKIESVGNGYYKIIAKHSGKCLDVYGASKADGANIIQFGCHGNDNQLFKIESK